MTTTAYKVFTHDLRPPIQGGDPVWSGALPHALPRVDVDTSHKDCAAGWNACVSPKDALRIAGLWPNGRPSRLFRVETDAEVYARGDKLRAATWHIVEELPVDHAVLALSKKWFGEERAPGMAAEQMAWRAALGRPERSAALVAQYLALALDVRGLGSWKLRRFDTARDAWAAWDARDAWAARAAWDARDARAAWDAWAARAAWDAWDARDARDAWDARDAREALIHHYACTMRWLDQDPAKYIVGIRDAYAAGLAIAIPTGTNELGWAMTEEAV